MHYSRFFHALHFLILVFFSAPWPLLRWKFRSVVDVLCGYDLILATPAEMAVLGFQLVTTLVAASVLSKIVTYFSFTRFLYDGLMRFAVPTDDQLLSAIGNHKTRNKSK